MKKQYRMKAHFVTLSLSTLAAASAGIANAGGISAANSDITIGGGAAGGYFSSTNTGSSNTDDIYLSDALLDISAKNGKGATAVVGVGVLRTPTVFNGGVTGVGAPGNAEVKYGWIDVQPMSNLTVSMGQLATPIGSEVAPTYANANATLGAVWNSQPVYYPGVRATYAMGGTNVFAEVNNDTSTGATKGYVAGVNGSAGSVTYAVAYYDADKARDIFDLIVSTTIGSMSVGINADYHMLDSSSKPGSDDSAMGVALFVKPVFGGISVPVRVEYLSDGDTGVYSYNSIGMKSGYSVTVTPTYNVGDNAFLRAEVSMVTADNKIFADKNAVAEDSQTSMLLQAGFKF